MTGEAVLPEPDGDPPRPDLPAPLEETGVESVGGTVASGPPGRSVSAAGRLAAMGDAEGFGGNDRDDNLELLRDDLRARDRLRAYQIMTGHFPTKHGPTAIGVAPPVHPKNYRGGHRAGRRDPRDDGGDAPSEETT